jgi:hypothetical protein
VVVILYFFMVDGDFYYITDLIDLGSAQIEDEHTIVVEHPAIESWSIHASISKRREGLPAICLY